MIAPPPMDINEYISIVLYSDSLYLLHWFAVFPCSLAGDVECASTYLYLLTVEYYNSVINRLEILKFLLK